MSPGTGSEQAAEEGEAPCRLLAENVADVVWTMDVELRFTWVSPSLSRLLGCTAAEAMSRRP